MKIMEQKCNYFKATLHRKFMVTVQRRVKRNPTCYFSMCKHCRFKQRTLENLRSGVQDDNGINIGYQI